MLGNATNLTNTTACLLVWRGFWKLLSDYRQELSALAALITIISVVIGLIFRRYLQKKQQAYDDKLRQQNIGNAVGQVIVALNNFETTWRAVQGKKRLHLEKDILFVLSMGINIKDAVLSIPTTLMDVDLSEVLNIANQLESLKKPLESVQPSDPFGSAQRTIPREEIDELAKRAGECAVELERWRSKK